MLRAEANTPPAHALALLTLTAARRGEILRAEWSQFELERAIWNRPASIMKGKKPAPLNLSADTVKLLRLMRAQADPAERFLFPGKDHGAGALRRFWDRVRAKAGIPDVRLHDLRHTFASYAYSAALLRRRSLRATSFRFPSFMFPQFRVGPFRHTLAASHLIHSKPRGEPPRVKFTEVLKIHAVLIATDSTSAVVETERILIITARNAWAGCPLRTPLVKLGNFVRGGHSLQLAGRSATTAPTLTELTPCSAT